MATLIWWCTLGVAAFCHECIENLLAFCGHPHLVVHPRGGRVLSRMYREFVGILWPPSLGVAAFCGRVHPSGWPRVLWLLPILRRGGGGVPILRRGGGGVLLTLHELGQEVFGQKRLYSSTQVSFSMEHHTEQHIRSTIRGEVIVTDQIERPRILG